jgi:DNA-binding NarL/FixJ family response regulator
LTFYSAEATFSHVGITLLNVITARISVKTPARHTASPADTTMSRAIDRPTPPAVEPGGESPIRVLIAVGSALVRAGYRALLESDGRIEVVGEAISGPGAVALATDTTLDVALLDLSLPGLDDPETAAAIISDTAFSGVCVMVLTDGESEERVFSALQAGAVGVLRTHAQPSELLVTVRLVARGHALLPTAAVRRMLEELPPRTRNTEQLPDPLSELTSRELEVVGLVARGLNNAEIAQHLTISPATAKTHVSRAVVKLRARSRAQLVAFAYRAGLVPVGRSGEHSGARAITVEA